MKPEKKRFSGKKMVFGGHFEFLWQNRKKIFSKSYIWQTTTNEPGILPENFENVSISTRVIGENPVFGGHFDFYDQTGSRVFEPTFLTSHFYRTWNLAIRILKIFQLNLDLLTETRFSAAILNFTTTPEVKF